MGLVNWVTHGALRREAKRIAKIVAERYPVVEAENPDRTETELVKDVFFDKDRLAQSPDEGRKHIEACCASAEGACYIFAIEAGRMKGFSQVRCLQFTGYMDAELYSRGFKPQSRETKAAVLAELGLLVDGWESWC
jgi:hypothetical protein